MDQKRLIKSLVRLNNRKGKPIDFTITTQNGVIIQLLDLQVETVDLDMVGNNVQLTGKFGDTKIVNCGGVDDVLHPTDK